MKMLNNFKTLIFVGLLVFSSLNAQANEEGVSCDDIYNVCVEKCEQSAQGSVECYTTCDDNYDKCLEVIPEPTE